MLASTLVRGVTAATRTTARVARVPRCATSGPCAHVHVGTSRTSVGAGCNVRHASSSPNNRTPAATADVAIIGGGIVGCAVQLELARRGLSSVVIDKGPGVGQGSTSYSSGIVRTYYSVLHSVQFSYEGLRVWEDWEDYVGVNDDAGMAHLRMCGGLILQSPESEHFVNTTCGLHDECGIPYYAWSLERLCEEYPFIDTSLFGPPKRVDDPEFGQSQEGKTLHGALHFPLTGYVSDPQLAARNLHNAAKHTAGGALAHTMTDTEFQRMLFSNGRVAGVEVTTAEGTKQVHAPVVLNAAGPHSSVVNRRVFGADDSPAKDDSTILTRPFRVEVANVHPPEGVDFGNNGYVTMDADVGLYFRPEVGNKIVIGSQEPLCDAEFEVFPGTPEECPGGLTEAWTNYVYRLAQRIPSLPIPGASNTQGVVAMYDQADDWTPIYDRSAIPGYYLAIGTSGNQFKNAGVIGGLVSDLIQYCEAGNDHDSDPMQHKLQRTGATLNTAHFSRKRQQLATSGSVLG